MFFEKDSLRTRMTFETGINTLGGSAIFIDQKGSRLGERETLADVAHNLERWIDVIVLRTFSHDTITEMAQFAPRPRGKCAQRYRTSLPGARRYFYA